MNFVRKFARVATVAAIFAMAPAAAQAQNFINVLTGGTAGVYYPLGVAISKILAEKMKDSRPSVQATKASVENLNLLQAGKGEIAFTLGDSLAAGYAGDQDAGFRGKLDKLRVVGAIYPNYIQIVASKESGIKTLADLKGKRLSVGAPKSGTELNARAILAAAGMKYENLGKVEYLPFAESVELIKNRQLDATLQSAGLGVASIKDLANSVEIVVVEIPADIITKAGAPFQSAVIPANTYQGQTAAVNSAIVPNYLVTRSDLPEAVVYQMTKAIFDSLPELVAAHAAARAIKLENAAKNPPVPLHPGAAKYFKEKGVGG
ncbi:MAG: TAXI family TRAP transporter solute-binding subunit [Xanthobacteraceae bacterium]|nr:TAXI family TRAP transporter solute-binding subunit [Xanthobacteraceae bacterium]MBX3522977.1 TAXI family TRAP transporter solute-binding subunit [Xanthobacteraceae bacterium]MBX3532996.1 TAXI family TRAP transporter solute-binding subunit [Xanthobacteraceae bacterium]MBX3549775.1 TAXI family TRAP transporter solute-binding subunit [Xanthobacteraceae bacterium]MCW5675001.1 TAXI family TRAP transporter solute-binding subunit [Xanthobacteraceae bacterium]